MKKLINKLQIFISLLFLLFGSVYFYQKYSNNGIIFNFYKYGLFNKNCNIYITKNIETIFGPYKIKNLFAEKIFNSNALLRMKNIDQGGPSYYFDLAPKFSRYDHCIGVCKLIEMYGGSEKEQLVGVLHDVSHTAFSHVADFFFTENEDENHSYQDKIHINYLSNSDIKNIIFEYGHDIESFDPDCGSYNMLEQSLPDMCADRIEYNLHTALVYNIYSKDEIDSILKDLRYENKKWFFVNIDAAIKFSRLPIKFMYEIWNSSDNVVLYDIFVKLLRKGIDLDIFKVDDLKTKDDLYIVSKLNKSNDKNIIELMNKCRNISKIFKVVSKEEDFDKYFKIKFRGIDPLVKLNGKFYRLTKLNEEFNNEYEKCKDYCKNGIYIKYL